MKRKILYILFLVFGLFVIASGKVSALGKQKMSVDLDYNDTFNIFYELKNATSLARTLIENGNNLKTFLIDKYNPFTDNSINSSIYAIWLDYVSSSEKESDDLSNAYYKFYLIYAYNSGGYYTQKGVSYYFDNQMNFIKYTGGGYSDIGLFNCNYMYCMTNDLNNNVTGTINYNNIYDFTKYYEGTINYKSSLNNDFILSYVIDNNRTYRIDDETNWFDSIKAIFSSDYNASDYIYNTGDKVVNLDWYLNNIVISNNTSLTPSHDCLYNFGNIQLGYEWTKINVTDYSNGLYLVPKVTSIEEGNNGNLYAYMTSNNAYLKGALVHFDSNGVASSSDIQHVININLGVMELGIINHGTFINADGKLALVSSNIDGESNFYKYAFYFTSSNIQDDIFIYYDEDIYNLVITNDNGFATLIDIDTGHSNNISTNSLKNYMNDYILEHDIHSGTYSSKYPSGVPSSWIDSGKSVDEYYMTNGGFNEFDTSTVFGNAKNIVSGLKSSISGFYSVVSVVLAPFPEYLSLIYFGITALIIISVWHFIRG